eukprot:763348-Hanusia_phi.AAC.3
MSSARRGPGRGPASPYGVCPALSGWRNPAVAGTHWHAGPIRSLGQSRLIPNGAEAAPRGNCAVLQCMPIQNLTLRMVTSFEAAARPAAAC